MEKSKLPVKRISPLVPWSFFDDFRTEMEKLWNWPLLARGESEAVDWHPRVDIFRKNGELVVKADLPGMTKSDVEVLVEEGDLILKGKRKQEVEIKEEDFYRCERSFGSFYRRMSIPEGVDAKKISASFVDGVLEVHVPMPPEKAAKPQKVAIH